MLMVKGLFLSLYFDILAKVVLEGLVMPAMAGREEFADYTTYMMADVELLGIIHAFALYSKVKTSYVFNIYSPTLSKMKFHQVLQFKNDLFHLSFSC
jgi:hypothetical protein